MHLAKRRKQEAQNYLSEAQKLDKRNMLADQIKMMKEQMKKASIPNQHYGNPTSARQDRRSRTINTKVMEPLSLAMASLIFCHLDRFIQDVDILIVQQSFRSSLNEI